MKFMNQSSYDISVYKGTNTISKIVIPTLEGNLEAKIGDYIIKGIKVNSILVEKIFLMLHMRRLKVIELKVEDYCQNCKNFEPIKMNSTQI